MKVIEIRDIVRKDVPIYYRRVYTGIAVLEFMEEHHDRRIEFSIETKPTGAKDIVVKLLEDIDYPLVPMTKALKDAIMAMDSSGALTC